MNGNMIYLIICRMMDGDQLKDHEQDQLEDWIYRFRFVLSVTWIMLLLTLGLSENSLWGLFTNKNFHSSMLFVSPPFLLLDVG